MRRVWLSPRLEMPAARFGCGRGPAQEPAMDANRFDSLTRSLPTSSRRETVRLLVGSLLGGLLPLDPLSLAAKSNRAKKQQSGKDRKQDDTHRQQRDGTDGKKGDTRPKQKDGKDPKQKRGAGQ